MKKKSLLVLGAVGLLGAYLLSRQNNAASSGTIGGGGSGSGLDTAQAAALQASTLSTMDQLVKDLLAQKTLLATATPGSGLGGTPGMNQNNSGTPSALYVTGGQVSPADAGNLGGGRSMNTQELMFQTSSGLMGLSPGSSAYKAATNTTYSNVGGKIVVRSGR